MDVLCNRAATLSKGPEFWSGGPDWHPKSIVSCDGARVKGDDGAWYVDFVSALGANLLGYPKDWDDGPFRRAMTTQSWYGAGYSLPHYLEQQVAEKLVNYLGSRVPSWTPEGLSVRYGLSGSDACAMAVRLARAVTGRKRIVSVGYHGWGGEFIAASPPAWGIPSQPVMAAVFGDLKSLHWVMGMDERVPAAVIIEQPPREVSEDYWADVRRLCTKYGVLLILDEVVTGFRYALGGAAEKFGIAPDIAVYGKALGNGVPISAMVFQRDYASWFSRNDPVFVSSTGFANAISLTAADAVLDLWNQDGVDHLWQIGEALINGLRKAGYIVVGYPPVSLIKFQSKAERAYFIAGMRDRGILINRPNIPNLAHTMADVAQTVEAARDVKAAMASADVEALMAGRLPATLFEGR